MDNFEFHSLKKTDLNPLVRKIWLFTSIIIGTIIAMLFLPWQQTVQGEGIIGFSQAFFYAGARSLLVSLWSVADQSTAELMNNFYDYLNKGYSEAEALRQAKIKFITGENRALRHPYFWAPFVVSGDWR